MKSNNPASLAVVDKGRDISAYMLSGLVGLGLVFATGSAFAGFQTYSGGLPEEAAWRSAVGTFALESFESYPGGTQIQSLPALGIAFDELAGGGYPQAYFFGTTPYGPTHLGNFPNGINSINQWDDIVVHPLPGVTMTALAFWNGDGQADTLVARAYDSSGSLLGTIGAFHGTFAGFISSGSVTKIVFDGITGDGWNHLDGLQTSFVSGQDITVPEPPTALMLLSGALGLLCYRRKYAPSGFRPEMADH